MPETATPDLVMARTQRGDGRGLLARLRDLLPEGRGLPQEEWRIRHRAVRIFILAHAIGLALFGLWRDELATGLVIGECLLLAAVGLLAGVRALSRKLRGALAALGCVMASAILVQFWGGVIEAHFHFFVVVALISLYQDWVPFGLAIVFVALDHGVTGVLLPEWVYNHDAAVNDPWRWAIIHAVFVLSECVALIAVWGANEKARAETDRVLRSTGEGLLGVDADCRITFANPAALRMASMGERDLLGKPLYGLLRGNDGRPAFAPDILRQTEGAFTSDAWLAGGNGTTTPVEILCTPIEGRQHQEGAVVAMRDITDRMHAEQGRLAAKQQASELEHLREVDSFKTRFMNMAAHELNTPLTPIKMQMHLLKSHAEEPQLEAHKRSIHLLDRNFQRLTGLVGDLLDSSRLQSDRMPIRPVTLDLSAVVTDVTESFRPSAKEMGVRLDADIQGDLTCGADPDRISQAITNLLSNAMKFTPSGGSVSVQAESLNGHIRVKVQDTGVGLTAEQAARLFKPFEQVHESQVHNKGGSGLGLYITRGIIELHGGRIWVESAGRGLGSSFIFEIPRNPPSAPATPQGGGPPVKPT
ncbi:MAG: PAS domain-containing sensor histidine kinase [Candidatus Thermoplasmatota archaeon]